MPVLLWGQSHPRASLFEQQRKRLQVETWLVQSTTGAYYIVLLPAMRADQIRQLKMRALQRSFTAGTLAVVSVERFAEATEKNGTPADFHQLHRTLDQATPVPARPSNFHSGLRSGRIAVFRYHSYCRFRSSTFPICTKPVAAGCSVSPSASIETTSGAAA